MSTYVNEAQIRLGFEFPAVTVDVTKAMIREYAYASADFNPLHLDESYMEQAEFGDTKFGQIIAHGLMTYSFGTRMITDVVYPLGGWHERHESRFIAPVYAGDTVTTHGKVTSLKPVGEEVLFTADVWVTNQEGVVVIRGDVMARVPAAAADLGDAG